MQPFTRLCSPTEQLSIPAMIGRHVPGTEQTITEIRRLGRQREGAGAVSCPVLIKFSNVAAKHAVYKHSKTLCSQKIYLDSDLTPQQRELRTKKRDGSQHLKTQEMKPFWREERLFCYIDGSPKENINPPPPPDMPPSPHMLKLQQDLRSHRELPAPRLTFCA